MSPKRGLILGLRIQSYYCLLPRREPISQVMVVGGSGGWEKGLLSLEGEKSGRS